MGTFTKWKSDQLLSHTRLSVHARITTEGQESCFECKSIGNNLSHGKQFDWKIDFWKIVPWWIRPAAGVRQGRSGRKRVTPQKKRRSYRNNRRTSQRQAAV